MRIAILHTYYQHTGGEDTVFHSECALLSSRGHEVITYTTSNQLLQRMNPFTISRNALWNPHIYRELLAWFRENRPDVAHFHNIFPLLSPSAYEAAFQAGIPIVQTLHNYRLICPQGQLLRKGRICELCVGRSFPIYGVMYGCYRNRLATLVKSLHILQQRRAGHWERAIQVFIALSEFSRQKFIQGGLPAEKVAVKPNFVHPDPGEGEHAGDYALFVGRLSPEKGITVLLDAWKRLPPTIPLKIVGDGPLAEAVRQAVAKLPHVEWVGHAPRETVLALMKQARLLVFPSICYENMSLSIVEAFATGLPVLASNHGSMTSLVRHGNTGWLFPPGDAQALSESVKELMNAPARLQAIGRQARAEYLQHYTAQRNYEQLMDIYQRAIRERQGETVCAS